MEFPTKFGWSFGRISGQRTLRALSKNTQSEDGKMDGKKNNSYSFISKQWEGHGAILFITLETV